MTGADVKIEDKGYPKSGMAKTAVKETGESIKLKSKKTERRGKKPTQPKKTMQVEASSTTEKKGHRTKTKRGKSISKKTSTKLPSTSKTAKSGESKRKAMVKRTISTCSEGTAITASMSSCSLSDSIQEEEDFLPTRQPVGSEEMTESARDSTRFLSRDAKAEMEAEKRAELLEQEARTRASFAAAFLAADRESRRPKREGSHQQKFKGEWWKNKACEDAGGEQQNENDDFIRQFEFDEKEIYRTIETILHSDQQRPPQEHVVVALGGHRAQSVSIFDLQWTILRFSETWNREDMTLIM